MLKNLYFFVVVVTLSFQLGSAALSTTEIQERQLEKDLRKCLHDLYSILLEKSPLAKSFDKQKEDAGRSDTGLIQQFIRCTSILDRVRQDSIELKASEKPAPLEVLQKLSEKTRGVIASTDDHPPYVRTVTRGLWSMCLPQFTTLVFWFIVILVHYIYACIQPYTTMRNVSLAMYFPFLVLLLTGYFVTYLNLKQEYLVRGYCAVGLLFGLAFILSFWRPMHLRILAEQKYLEDTNRKIVMEKLGSLEISS